MCSFLTTESPAKISWRGHDGWIEKHNRLETTPVIVVKSDDWERSSIVGSVLGRVRLARFLFIETVGIKEMDTAGKPMILLRDLILLFFSHKSQLFSFTPELTSEDHKTFFFFSSRSLQSN